MNLPIGKAEALGLVRALMDDMAVAGDAEGHLSLFEREHFARRVVELKDRLRPVAGPVTMAQLDNIERGIG